MYSKAEQTEKFVLFVVIVLVLFGIIHPVLSDETNMVGVTIDGNDKWAVVFSKYETRLGLGQFNVTGSGTYKTIIADLTPETSHDVIVDKDILPVVSTTTTSSGLLVFSDFSLSLTEPPGHSVDVWNDEMSSLPNIQIRPYRNTNLLGTETWYAGSTYLIAGDITVDNGATLTVQAGVVVKCAPGVQITVKGTLDVDGTSENDIVVFTSVFDDDYGESLDGWGIPFPYSEREPASGDWHGIHLDGGTGLFDYCHIRYGGAPFNIKDNLHFDQSGPDSHFTHSVSEFSDNHGVRITDCSPVLKFRHSRISENDSDGVHIDEGTDNPDLGTSGDYGYNYIWGNDGCELYNHTNNNTINAIGNYWGNGGICGDAYTDAPQYETKHGNVSGQTWTELTYLITGDLVVDDGETLTVKEEAVVKFDPGRKMTVYGTLIVEGEIIIGLGGPDEVRMIVFTSRDDNTCGVTVPDSDGVPEAGDWVGIHLDGSGDNDGVGKFDWCTIRYGGSSSPDGSNLHFDQSDPTPESYFRGSVSEYSGSYGVRITDSSPEFRRSRVSASNRDGVYIEVDGTVANPDLGTGDEENSENWGHNSIRDNAPDSDGYELNNTTTNSINAVGNYWGTAGIHSDSNVNYSPSLDEDPTMVVLSSFTAKTEGGKVILVWRTEAEIDNVGFAIYRSDTKDGDYTRITFVPGAEDSETSNDYQFTDEHVQPGHTYYYYLEDVDLAGKRTRSKVVKVTLVPPILSKIRPKKNSLLKNYPNPCNPETWIPYNLAEAADVTIQIYDIAGRLIRTLHLGYKPAGFHSSKDTAAYWDGRNGTGERVSTGVYFYCLSAGEFFAVRKMIILM